MLLSEGFLYIGVVFKCIYVIWLFFYDYFLFVCIFLCFLNFICVSCPNLVCV